MTHREEYELLRTLARRPEVWSVYTASDLWTDNHISARMLEFHLDPDSEPASRTREFIDRSADWISDHFGLADGIRLLDLGCGPGLYTSRFHDAGAEVTGIDFSRRSLDYARRTAEEDGRAIRYIEGNYLELEFPGPFDLATLIYCDFCALSPHQRRTLLGRIRAALAPKGRLLLDVVSLRAFEAKAEDSRIAENMMDGFWSAGDYVGVRRTWKYDDEKVILDRYGIFGTDSRKEICNWLQYFSPETLKKELEEGGFNVVATYANVAGDPYDKESDIIAVVAELNREK